jgi:endonuclease/exonuclease/phosphatase family metal-dependent hydrolase
MDSANRSSARRAFAFARRHRWGFLTLATALFVWGVGAVGTPAPVLMAGALATIGGLQMLALGRLGRRRRVALAADRGRTQTSLALYATSLMLASSFLAGLIVAPRSATVMGMPSIAPESPRVTAAWWMPSLVAMPAVERWASKLPALYEWGSPRPLVAESRLGSGPAGGSQRGADLGLRPGDAEVRLREEESVMVPVLADRDDTLRVLSFNVWHGYPGPGAREERYQHIRDLVVESGADVVLLQEAWSTRRFGSLAERLSRELDLGYAYARANGSLRYLGFEEGLAILSRHPISEVRRLALGPRMPPWEMRAALGAVVTVPGGEPLEVWNTHLSHSDAFAREGQARALAAALAGSRIALLGGDFNAAAGSAAVAAFTEVELEPVLSEGIDHILASPELRRQWTPVRAEARRFGVVEVPGTLLTRPEVSDHPALLVELRRREPSGEARIAALPPAPGP